MEEILAQLQKMLDEYNVKYYVPPVAQNNEVDLTAPFSYILKLMEEKMPAVFVWLSARLERNNKF